MANKFAALLVMCLVLVAAVHVPSAQATDMDEYASCFKDCEKACQDKGNGYSFCEMKCDTDCFDKEIAAKLQHLKGH